MNLGANIVGQNETKAKYLTCFLVYYVTRYICLRCKWLFYASVSFKSMGVFPSVVNISFRNALSPFRNALSPFGNALISFGNALISFGNALSPFRNALISLQVALSPLQVALFPFMAIFS